MTMETIPAASLVLPQVKIKHPLDIFFFVRLFFSVAFRFIPSFSNFPHLCVRFRRWFCPVPLFRIGWGLFWWIPSNSDGEIDSGTISGPTAVQHLVSTSALVFLTSAAGIPAAAAAVLPHLQQQQEARYRMQQLHHQHHQQQSCVHPKRFLLKRDSNISLESTSSSNGIWLRVCISPVCESVIRSLG